MHTGMTQGRLDLDTGRAGQGGSTGRRSREDRRKDSWGITFGFGAGNEGSN